MATAKRIDAPPPPPSVRLELTEEEAGFLFRLVATRVVGSGPEQATNDRIYYALAELNPARTDTLWEGQVRIHEDN